MPAKLYKYRAFSVRCLRSITEAEIFYAQPNTFNDPLDCDPTIEVDMDLNSLEKLLFRMMTQQGERQAASDEIHHLRYLSTEHGDYQEKGEARVYLKQMLAQRIKKALDLELGNAGVLSLSATWQSALMWSHYADEHRGMCIEYDIRDQPHPNLLPVNYQAPRAVKVSDLWGWKIHDQPASRERVMQTYFYSKSSEWKYEREWRDVSYKSGPMFLPFRITAIHFGLRCDSAVVTSVVKLLNDHSHIKLWQIRPKEESFKLRRSLVDRGEIEAIGVREPPFLMFKDIVLSEADEILDGNDDDFEDAGVNG